MIFIAKQLHFFSLFLNPLSGNVMLQFDEECRQLLGPAYIPMLRQQLENALKQVEKIEREISE